jgi:hypothetical protein
MLHDDPSPLGIHQLERVLIDRRVLRVVSENLRRCHEWEDGGTRKDESRVGWEQFIAVRPVSFPMPTLRTISASVSFGLKTASDLSDRP